MVHVSIFLTPFDRSATRFYFSISTTYCKKIIWIIFPFRNRTFTCLFVKVLFYMWKVVHKLCLFTFWINWSYWLKWLVWLRCLLSKSKRRTSVTAKMPTLAIILPNVFFLESNLHRVDLRVLLIKFAILCTAHFDDVLIILCVKGALLSREIAFIQTAPKILNCGIVFFITLEIL